MLYVDAIRILEKIAQARFLHATMPKQEEIEEAKMELQRLMHEMWKQIQKVADADARDLLTKRYLEFKPWKVVASELDYSVQHIYYLHNKALEKLRVHQSS